MLKLKGMNISAPLDFKGWTAEKYAETFYLSANYKTMPEPLRSEALKSDWGAIEKCFPKKKIRRKEE